MNAKTKNAEQLGLFAGDLQLGGKTDDAVLSGSNDSSYVVYVDESGDHGMGNIDQNYPVFVLAFCVFHKKYYAENVVPAVEKFKFRHFGHDLVVLHEHEIRKETGAFNFFSNKQHHQAFLGDLTAIIESSNFVLFSCAIDKNKLAKRKELPDNLYHLALGQCLESLYEFLKEKIKKNSRRTSLWSAGESVKIRIWSSSFDAIAMAEIAKDSSFRSMWFSPTRRRTHMGFSWWT
ncbi:hypothetical protein ABIC89_000858 [Variovorax boronicumulans]